MNSRMDKYELDTPALKSRTDRNKELYRSYEALNYDKFDVNNNVEILKSNARNIDVDQIRDMLDKKYRDNLPKRKSISIDNYEEPVRKDEEDTKEYDINSILDKAKSDKSVDYELDRLNRSYNASKLVDEVNKKYGQREETPAEKELVNLINTITELELKNRQKDAELLDLADDDEKEEDNSNTAATSIITDTEETFYTGQLAVKEEDFEDFKDMQDDIKSNSALIKILIFVFIIITIAIGVVLANKYLESTTQYDIPYTQTISFDTELLSMYSDISIRIISFSFPNRLSATAFDNSVFPTPVGPKNINELIGLSGFLKPTLLLFIALATVFTASSCPIILLCKVSSKFLNFSVSLSFIFCTGIPVLFAIISAISSVVISINSFLALKSQLSFSCSNSWFNFSSSFLNSAAFSKFCTFMLSSFSSFISSMFFSNSFIFSGCLNAFIFTLDAASSIKSIALSGRNLSFIYLLDNSTDAIIASSVIFKL